MAVLVGSIVGGLALVLLLLALVWPFYRRKSAKVVVAGNDMNEETWEKAPGRHTRRAFVACLPFAHC